MPGNLRRVARTVESRLAIAASVVATWCLLSAAAPPLQAGPLDRQVAEWVLLMGGSVRLEGGSDRIREVTQLPADDFHLELADLVGTNLLPPDLQRLAGLKHLKTLNLPGPMWNPGAGARTDYSKDLRHLAGLATLEELTFSYTYLESIKFQDDGIEAIAALGPNLRVLSLENTQVRGHHLAPFTNLEALDLVYCPVDDRGLKQIQGLTRLRRLLLRDAVISDEAMQNLRGLVDVEHLDLGGTRITDAGVAQLRGMTRLRKLNLQGALMTDEGTGHLAGMTGLEELNLYGTRISNAAVDVLKDLKALRTVDLRYTRVTRTGVDRLVSALPQCRVTFLDSSVAPALSPTASADVSGADDATVAGWARALGGKAVVEDGRLREVVLAGTGVTDDLLRNLSGRKHLRKLDLSATDVGDPGVRQLAGLLGLVDLDLSGTTVSDAGLPPLAGLTGLRRLGLANTQIAGSGLKSLEGLALEELRLSGSPINDRALVHVAAMGSLRDLKLAYTDVTDAGLATLAPLGVLRRLDLAGTDVGDKGLPHLAKLTGLTALSLSYTRITDGGMSRLENLESLQELSLLRTRVTDRSMAVVGRLTHLEDLNLDYTDVGDKGLEALGGLTRLRRLSLDSTGATDASAKRLAGFPQLRTLNLYHTFITVQGYQQIYVALPECRIIWDPKSSDPKRRRS
jgi:Leucine-rich repeat (LRR) protein